MQQPTHPSFHKKIVSSILKVSVITLSLIFSIVMRGQENYEKEILKHMKAKKIEWIPGTDNLAKVKMKSSKKWGVYSIDVYDLADELEINTEEIVGPKFDSIGWFKDMEPFVIVKDKNKYGLLLNPYEVHDPTKKAECKYDAIKMVEDGGRNYAVVRMDSKWGLVDWFEGIMLVDPSFDTAAEVPLVWVESWAMDTFKEAKKILGADIVIFDEGNGDGVLKARSKATKKWGMYQFLNDNEITTLIPALYDKIDFFPFNGNYTAVYKNGKVGFYLSYWSYNEKADQTVSCRYDSYKRYNADGVSKLAVQKEGKWGWVDWLTGEEKSEFIAASPDDLSYPNYKQEIWLED